MAQKRPMSPLERRGAALSVLVVCLGSGMVPVAALLPRTTGTAHAWVIAALVALVVVIATLCLLAGMAVGSSRSRRQR